MHPTKLTALAAISLLALSACSSTPPVQSCPKLPLVPAWLMQPEPDLIPHLDNIVKPNQLPS